MEGVSLDDATLAFTARNSLERMASRFFDSPETLEELQRLRRRVRLVLSLPFEVNLWRLQNLYFLGVKRLLAVKKDHPASKDWLDEILSLGNDLSIHLPAGSDS